MPKHVLVIGAGIAGLATAFELARRGDQVEVLESGMPGRQSSWAGAGILSLLLPWNYAVEVAALAERSLGLYPAWIEAIRRTAPTDPEYRQSGMLVLSPWEEGKALSWLAQRGRPRATVPPAVIAALVSPGEGLWLPWVAQVRNPRLIQACTEALHGLGVRVHPMTAVTRIESRQGEVVAVHSQDRRWQADTYVVSAGAWSRQVLGELGSALPIHPIRGQILLYKAGPQRLPFIVYRDGHYLVPRQDGHILAGSTLEDVGFDVSTTDAAAVELEGFIRSLLPDVAATGPIRHWAGLRPGSPGNRPIIGRHPALANLYVNSGHFRYGVTLAPASAELLADLIHGHSPVLDATMYRWPDAEPTLL